MFRQGCQLGIEVGEERRDKNQLRRGRYILKLGGFCYRQGEREWFLFKNIFNFIYQEENRNEFDLNEIDLNSNFNYFNGVQL